MNDKVYWIWLARACGAGNRNVEILLHTIGDAKELYHTTPETFAAVERRYDLRLGNALNNKSLREAWQIFRWCEDNKVAVVTLEDDEFPKILFTLPDMPVVLYVLGTLPNFDHKFCTAVVGTRRMSEYGKRIAYTMGNGLGAAGSCIVSGMALGIDGMAMAGAIDAGAVTVAVLGCGIDRIYPPEHEELFSRILEKGAIITEYVPGTPPEGQNFPVRNRIISGLCQATLVIEADARSGALITARHALAQNRRVFAVPGNIGDPGSSGTNSLMKQNGVSIATTPADVLRDYETLYPELDLSMCSGTQSVERSLARATETAEKHRIVSRGDRTNLYGTGAYGGKAHGNKLLNRIKKTKNDINKNDGQADVTNAEKAPVKTAHIDTEMLGETEKKVYDMMKPDVPMLPDELAHKGLKVPDVLSALTMLEIAGAVEASPGGFYIKRS